MLPTLIPTGIAAACKANPITQVCTTATVTVSWNAVTTADAPVKVAGPFVYHVERNGTALPACDRKTQGGDGKKVVSCTDEPGAGTHSHRVYSADPGGANPSPLSAATVAVEP